MNKAVEKMMTLTYGTELELENITQKQAIYAVKSVVGGTVRYRPELGYHTWTCTASDGRVWKAVSDASLRGGMNSAEVVTPVLKWEDMETLQNVVRALRAEGAKAPESTSQHIHIGAGDMTVKEIVNLVKWEYKFEEYLVKCLGTYENRLARWCRPTEKAFVDKVAEGKTNTLRKLNEDWYGYYNENPMHYDSTRYHFMNLHALFTKGTIEWRGQNGSLHAGEIKARIILCLAMTAHAMLMKHCTCEKVEFKPATAKRAFTQGLNHLGLDGEEFKNVRMHLTKNLAIA